MGPCILRALGFAPAGHPKNSSLPSVKVSLEKKIALGFAVAVLLLLGAGASGLWNASRFDSAIRQVDRTHEVLDLLDQVQTDVLAMQTGARGFALTGSELSLEPYKAGAADLAETLGRLRRLGTDNPAQLRRLDMLGPLATGFGSMMAGLVADRRGPGFDPLRSPESFMRGQQAVDQIVASIGAMKAEETRLLSRRLAETQSAGHVNLAAILAVGALATALVAAAGFMVHRDFRLRRGAEEALRSSEERYRSLFSSLDEGFCVIEVMFDDRQRPVDYRFLEISPSFEKQTGLRDAVGKRMRELAPQHESHWFEIYGKVALTGEPTRFQNRAEQLHRWYDVYAFRIGEPRDRQVAILFNDITERKRTEADLAERTAQLEAANGELEAFAYSVSHDLRAPLRHVDGFAGLLEKHSGGALDEKGRHYVRTMREAAVNMGRLIDDLLAFSRIGRASLSVGNVASDELLAAVIRDGRYDAGGRAIVWEIAPLPPVRADGPMLRQVWANLIDNAVKYSRLSSPARIAVSCSSTAGPSPEHVFCVRDNGVGFDPAYADKLFGVFQRLHSSAQFEGTGIGLANVRRIVARHGGRTWAESESGKGAAFFFSLPIATKS